MKTLNIQQNNNTEGVEALLAGANELRNKNAARSLELSKQAIKLAESINYQRGMAKANFNAGVCSRLTSNFETALQFYDKAISLYRLIDDKKGESRVMNSIANVYLSLGDFKVAAEYFDECVYLLESMGDIEFEATVLANKALSCQQQGNLIASLENNLQSLSLYKTIDKPVPHTLLNNIGIIYLEIGNYQVALKYFNSALKTEEEAGNLLDESFTLANIGRTYVYMNDPANAVTYLSEALIITKRYGNRQAESQIFSNLGKAYIKLRCYPEAVIYMNKALKYYKEIGDKSSISHSLAELGELYFQLNDFITSKKYFNEGLAIALEINDEINEVRNYTGLAGLYIKFMDLDSADKYLEKAAALAEKRKSYKELSKIFKLLSDGYMSVGRTTESNKYLDMHYDYLKKLIKIEEENSIRVFTATHNFHTAEIKPNFHEKSEYYEFYVNQKSSEVLKQAAI
jgi:tetratricopeptide (TPR) repeat protein